MPTQIRPTDPFPNLTEYAWDQPELISWFHRLEFTVGDLTSVVQNITSESSSGSPAGASSSEIENLAESISSLSRANAETATPGGANTQVQFNDSGVFGGDAELTWDKTANTLTIGDTFAGFVTGAPNPGAGTGGSLLIQGGIPTDGAGGQLLFLGQAGVGTNKAGGAIALIGGDSTGSGAAGSVNLASGNGGSTAQGAQVNISAGQGGSTSGGGGQISIQGGGSTDGDGGAISITSGTASGTARVGGNVNIFAGNSSDTFPGGSFQMKAGSTVTGSGGLTSILGGTGGSTSGDGGSVSLSGGTVTSGNGGSIDINGVDGAGTNKNGGNVDITSGAPTGSGISGRITETTSGGFKLTRAGNFASSGDAQSNEYVLRTQTTNATVTEMFLDGTGGSKRMVLVSDSTWKYECHVVARRTDADNESAGYQYAGVIDNNAGTTALVGTVQTIMTEQEDVAAWAVIITADNTNDSLKVEVTGEAGKAIRWVAFIRTVEVTG